MICLLKCRVNKEEYVLTLAPSLFIYLIQSSVHKLILNK